MPIPNLESQTPINQYTAQAGQTEFAFTFYFFEISDIKVYVNDVLKTLTTDYVVKKNDGTTIGSSDLPLTGAKIVFNSGQTAGAKISISREVPINRSTQFTTGGNFKADAFNTELTRILSIQQQLNRDINRSFRLAPSDAEGGSLQLPTNRADNILAFDGSGNLILIKLADIDKASVSPYIKTLLDDVSASAARGTLDAQQLNANLTALAGLTGASNKLPYFTGSGAMAVKDLIATATNQGISFLSNPIAIANNATTSSTDIDFSGGIINFSDGSGQAIAPALTKRLQSTGSWSAGAGGNMLLSGARANSSTYHLYAIYNPTTNTTEYGALLGVAGTSPDPTSVLPSGYTKFKRLASILTDGSANIRNASYTFFTGGYYCNYNSTISDASSISLTTTRASLAISTPRGINVIANVHPFFDIINARDTITIFEGGTSIPYFLIRGGANTIANAQVGSNGLVKTNKSSQIDWSTGAYLLTVSLNTYGFTDYTN